MTTEHAGDDAGRLEALTALATTARHAVLVGQALIALAEHVENTIDSLAVRTGHTVESVYAPLWGPEGAP